MKNIDELLKNAVSKVSKQVKTQKKERKVFSVAKEALQQQLSSHTNLTIDNSNDAVGIVDISKMNIKDNNKWKQKQIPDWTSRDFAYYMKDKFYQKYRKQWQYNVCSVPFALTKVKQQLKNGNGFCDNIVLKSYIDFFFKSKIDNFIIVKKYTNWIGCLSRQYQVANFLKTFKYPTINQPKKTKNLDDSIYGQINQFYKMGVYDMLMQFGIFASINYLITIERSKQQAYDQVINAIKIAQIRDKNLTVIKSTIKYCACPKNSKIINLEQFISILKQKHNIDLKIDAVFYLTKDCNFF